MPTINIEPKAMQNGDNVTTYKDTVGPQQQTYTFLTSQERVILKNSGSKNITYTVGSQSGTLGPSQMVDVKETISSINLTAEQGTQQFEIWADESGTKGTSPEAVQSLGDQVSGFASSLAEKSSQLAFVYNDFTNKPNGILTLLDSKQTVANFGGMPLYVQNGLLIHDSHPTQQNSAGYMQTVLPSKLTRIGVEFIIPPGSDGTVDLVAPGEDWSANSLYLNAGVHFVISRTYWRYGFRENGTDPILVNTNFAIPLVDDGVTIHKLEIILDHQSHIATVFLPDGSIAVTPADTRITNLTNNYALWEIYEYNVDPATSRKTPLKIKSLWASHDQIDTKAYKGSATIYDLIKVAGNIKNQITQKFPGTTFYAPNPGVQFTPTTTMTVIDSTNMKVTGIPSDSGKLLVEVQVWVENTVAGSNYLMALSDSSGQYGFQRVFVDSKKGVATLKWLKTGLTPNAPYTVSLCHMATISGPVLKADGNQGQYFFMTATPL
jgi:hypothetical protein